MPHGDDESAITRMHTRRLLQYIEKQLSDILTETVFGDYNTSIVRHSVQMQMTNYLNYLYQKNSIKDYQVVCDETNNSSATIGRNQLVAEVWLQPSISWPIHFEFVAESDETEPDYLAITRAIASEY